MHRSRNDISGFTLIELLLVMIVLAILAGIVIPRFFGTKEKALVAALRSDLRNLTNAQSAYHSDYQTYASTLADVKGVFTPSAGVTIEIDSATATGWGASASHPSAGPVCTVAVSDQRAGVPQCSEP